MGHTRLGPLPKTRKWKDLVEQLAGTGVAGDISPTPLSIDAIASQTLDASQRALDNAKRDAGVRYTFYLLTQIALAARSIDWGKNLAKHGIHLTANSTVFDLTVELQSAIDRYLNESASGATDLSEMAQQSIGEALSSLAYKQTINLFEGGSGEVKRTVQWVSTRRGFGELGQRFFGSFVARFLNFYLSRATAAALGSPRLTDLRKVAEFNEALRVHCYESARIVRDFCGGWYSKNAYQEGINLGNTSMFLAVAVKKLRSELQQQGGEA